MSQELANMGNGTPSATLAAGNVANVNPLIFGANIPASSTLPNPKL